MAAGGGEIGRGGVSPRLRVGAGERGKSARRKAGKYRGGGSCVCGVFFVSPSGCRRPPTRASRRRPSGGRRCGPSRAGASGGTPSPPPPSRRRPVGAAGRRRRRRRRRRPRTTTSSRRSTILAGWIRNAFSGATGRRHPSFEGRHGRTRALVYNTHIIFIS